MLLSLALISGCGDDAEDVDEPGEATEEAAEETTEEAAPEQAELQELKIGVLSDLSGPTGDVGNPYAEGVMDCIAYLNANGGVGGYEIVAYQEDYAYDVQKALTYYEQFKNKGIVALQGWGTGDTEALMSFVAQDEIPTLSASYSAHLTDPNTAPYNFFVAADYTTQMRAALKYFADNWSGSEAPKLALIYPDHPYGLSPIEGAKAYAEELGFEIVGEVNVELRAMDATTQLTDLMEDSPDYVWIGGTTDSTSVILKDAEKLGFETTFFINIWGNDENLVELAGDAVNGHIGLQATAVYDDDTPGTTVIREITGGEHKMTHYVRGFASMLVMAEGIRIAAEQGEVTGPSLKAALESLRDFDPMGLTPPISYFEDDHRPNLSVNLYELQADGLHFKASQTLERKAEWLGM
ncbi:MAG: ABC transporter substrate-binding protein [Desulfovibrio sp.]|nr:MAG: ABC transporter substrate-binding protein [Desulfovibrio sp.]